MGCDIHAWVYARYKDDPQDKPHWWLMLTLDCWRDYDWFCALAGVRCCHAPAHDPPPWADRGWPDFVYRSLSERDWTYGATWVSLGELRQAMARYQDREDKGCMPHPTWRGVEAFMAQMDSEGWETRLVFSFDN